MQTLNIFTAKPDSIASGRADFLLIMPAHEEALSLEKISTRGENLFSPTLLTYALSKCNPFSNIEIFKLTQKPQNTQDIFTQGMAFGRSYELRGNYLILAQNAEDSLQSTLYTLALLKDETQMSTFEKLSCSRDALTLFCAGFLLEASRRFHVVAGGGLEMVLALLVADMLRADILMRPQSQNITYATTAWALKDRKIIELLEQLSCAPHAIYTECSLESSEIEELKAIGSLAQGDQAGAGAALAYAALHGIDDETLINEMELIVYMI